MVVSSTLCAETLALTEAAEQSFQVRAVIIELLGLTDSKWLSINVKTDNQLLFDSINATKTVDDK